MSVPLHGQDAVDFLYRGMDDNIGTSFCHRIEKESRDALPANLLVKIESFSLLSKYDIDKYEYREFQSGGYKWKVTINYDDDDSISVHFSMVDPHLLPIGWKVNTSLAFFIYNHKENNYTCFRETFDCGFSVDIPRWIMSNVISRKDLEDATSGYVVDDCCEFGAEVAVAPSECICESMILAQHAALTTWKWMIPYFSKMEDAWRSRNFSSGDYTWKVKLYPRGVSSLPRNRYVSVFLKSSDFPPHHRVKVLVEFRIRNNHSGAIFSDTCSHWYTTSCVKSGFKKFISLADMRCSSNGFLADDCCLLEVDITVQAVVYDEPNNHGASCSGNAPYNHGASYCV